MTIISIFSISCDAPQRTRYPSSTAYNGGGDNGSFTDDGQGQVEDTGGQGIETTNTDSEPGFSNCANTPQYAGGSIGYFDLCQHDNDERRYKALFAQGDTSGTCFVPVHLQGAQSFKLGKAECVHNAANQNYFMTLSKEMVPPTFTYPRSESINGVMVLKATSLNAYMGCMNSKEDYLLSGYSQVNPGQPCCFQRIYHSGRYHCLQANPTCDSAANNAAAVTCNNFKSTHGSNYKLVPFEN